MVYEIYVVFGFENIKVKLFICLEKCVGVDEIWDKLEVVFVDVFKVNDIEFDYQFGEGVFYGLKIEFILYDCLDCVWQCGIVQLDFLMLGCLGFIYVVEDGECKVLVMIYCVILGLLECFIGILIEEFVGFFLFWLVFQQVVVMNIIDK